KLPSFPGQRVRGARAGAGYAAGEAAPPGVPRWGGVEMPRGTPAGPRLMRRLPDWIEAQPYESIQGQPLSPTIGALVTGVDLAPMPDAEVRDELHRALLEHKVLFLRDQELSPDEHIAFARTWGPLEVHPVLGQGSQPEIVRFEKDGTDRR